MLRLTTNVTVSPGELGAQLVGGRRASSSIASGRVSANSAVSSSGVSALAVAARARSPGRRGRRGSRTAAPCGRSRARGMKLQ